MSDDYRGMSAQDLEWHLAKADKALREAQAHRDVIAAAFEAALAEIKAKREAA